jgi:hypothetical protein
VIPEGQKIVVAVSSGNSQRRPAHLQVRSRHLPGIDRIPQVNIGVTAGPNVAHRGESSHQGHPGVDHAVNGFFRVGRSHFVKRIEIRVHGQMRVHIDQTRHHRHPAQIDDPIPGLSSNRRRGPDRLNRVTNDHDGLRIGEFAGLHVQHVASLNQRALATAALG